jgi:hypothetical protein
MLTALELDNRRLVQIILCGQPSLLTTLKGEAMYALNERITRRVTLAPLTPDDVDPYIQHRLAVAGGAAAVSFDPAATRVVADLSHGLPRRINVLCDRSLQEGRIEGASVITPDLVKRAARALAGLAAEPTPVVPGPLPQAASAPTGSAAAGSQPGPSAQTEQTAPDAERDVEMTFGQVPDAQGKMRKVLLAIIAGLATVLVAGYVYYAHQIVSEGRRIPTAPAPPTRNIGQPIKPLPVPAEPAPTPAPTAAPPPAAPAPTAPASGQLPGNPDQLH